MKPLLVLSLLLTAGCTGFAASKSGTFTGEIMDRACAKMGSHENMMQAEGTKSAKECTLACIKNGDKFALFDSSTKKVYPIDDDKKVQAFAGQRVQISGSYDDKADVLRVDSIAAAH